jgi:nucleotide-binding universal stress UspA family protein
MPARYVAIIGATWALIGLILAFTMRRRGHDLIVWLVLGVILGPFAIPLAVERARFHGGERSTSAQKPTPAHIGFDILVGVDGSDEARRALDSALALFGWYLTGMTIATVLDFDSELSPAAEERRAKAQEMLDGVAEVLVFEPIKTKVLFGIPDRALSDFARTSGMEMIVVGARGRGASERLFGSVTERLVGGSEIPVFVGPKLTGELSI